jgi:hypothetical protein
MRQRIDFARHRQRGGIELDLYLQRSRRAVEGVLAVTVLLFLWGLVLAPL